MLVITSLDEGGYHRTLTLSAVRQRAVTVLRLHEADAKGGISGKLIGSIVLSEQDAAELKRNL
jgi:hypothetical protein